MAHGRFLRADERLQDGEFDLIFDYTVSRHPRPFLCLFFPFHLMAAPEQKATKPPVVSVRSPSRGSTKMGSAYVAAPQSERRPASLPRMASS